MNSHEQTIVNNPLNQNLKENSLKNYSKHTQKKIIDYSKNYSNIKYKIKMSKIYSKQIICFSIIYIFILGEVKPQQTIDTLEIAKQLRSKGEIQKEFIYLQLYSKAHPLNTDAAWLLGQSAFSLGKYSIMKKSYEAAIKSDNENYYLKLDYAFKLVEAGELQKAKQLLISYIPYDSLNPRLFATLAKINYWQGDYKTAYQYILKSITLDESTSETRELYNKIKEAKTPFVELNTDYSLDNQPLKTISL